MIFSKACEYGIRAASYIALQSLHGRRTNLKEISEEIGSPEAFTAKILQAMVRHNVIDSVKGAQGGFEVERKKMNRLTLMDIVTAIDGPYNEKRCVLGLSHCSQKNPCPVHDKYKNIKAQLQNMLHNTSLFEMSSDLKSGLTCLKI
jgi:Rrf2 family iron-sulfur cluster assembly transcriptional regulator